MKKTALLIMTMLIAACASTPKVDELGQAPNCIVLRDNGMFSASVEPEAKLATIDTKDCTLGFWLCTKIIAQIDENGVLMTARDTTFGSAKAKFGTLKGQSIEMPEITSREGKALVSLTEKVAKVTSNQIKIDRKAGVIQWPSVTGFDGGTHEGMKLHFSPKCTNEQVAVGAAVIHRRNQAEY